MATLFQLIIAGVWAGTLVTHTRRLFRLACVAQLRAWERQPVRSGLSRVWWWLGKDEFWDAVRIDCLRAIELTAMIGLIAWGMAG